MGRMSPAVKMKENAPGSPKAKSVVKVVVAVGALLPKAGCVRTWALTKATKSEDDGPIGPDPEPPPDVPVPDIAVLLSLPPPQPVNARPTAPIMVQSAIFMVSLCGTQWPAAVPVEVGRLEMAVRAEFGPPGSGAARYGKAGR
jgi:hypothetical protein